MSSMQFCAECNNMLYPKEKKDQKKLYYACRNCGYEVAAEQPKLFTNEVQATHKPFVVVNRDITLDPTLPRTNKVECKDCGGREVVFFPASEEDMSLVFVCCNQDCIKHWTQEQFAPEKA